MDNGFEIGFAGCDVGYCPIGTDVAMCYYLQERQCGTSSFSTSKFMSILGGHASPWHYHTLIAGELTTNLTHSPLVGVILDGRGIYGMYESVGVTPILDACGGHYGVRL